MGAFGKIKNSAAQSANWTAEIFFYRLPSPGLDFLAGLGGMRFNVDNSDFLGSTFLTYIITKGE
jgi:hypothetical protein